MLFLIGHDARLDSRRGCRPLRLGAIETTISTTARGFRTAPAAPRAMDSAMDSTMDSQSIVESDNCLHIGIFRSRLEPDYPPPTLCVSGSLARADCWGAAGGCEGLLEAVGVGGVGLFRSWGPER
jgi:hypothetical protein